MKCLIERLSTELSNPNLPVLDLTVSNYLKAIQDDTYASEISALYNSLKELGVLHYFDAIIPILGNAPDKAVLNLLDPSKFYSYPDDLTVTSSGILSNGSTSLIDGNIPVKTYSKGQWTIIAAYKNTISTSQKMVVQTESIGRIATAKKDSTHNYNIIYSTWREVNGLGQNEAYLTSVFPVPYSGDPENKYVQYYLFGTNLDDRAYIATPNDNAYAVIEDKLIIPAYSETLFVAILNNRLFNIAKGQEIIDSISAFIQDTKGFTLV